MATLREAPPVYYGATRDTLLNDAPDLPATPDDASTPYDFLGGGYPFPAVPDASGSVLPGAAYSGLGQYLGVTLPSDVAAQASRALVPDAAPMAPAVPPAGTPSLATPAEHDALDDPYPTPRPYITDFPSPIAAPARRDIPQYDSAEEARRVGRLTNSPWLKAAAIGLGLLGGPQGLALGAGLIPSVGTGARAGAREALGADYNRALQDYQLGTQQDQQDFNDAQRTRQEQLGNIEAQNQLTGRLNQGDIAKWTAQGNRKQQIEAQQAREDQAKALDEWRKAQINQKQQTAAQRAALDRLNVLKPLLKSGVMTSEGEASVAEALRQAGGIENLPDDFLNDMTPDQKAKLSEMDENRDSRERIAAAREAGANLRNQARIDAARQRQQSMQTFSKQFKKAGAGPGSQLFNAWKSMEVSLRAEDSRINSLRQAQARIDSGITGVKKSAVFSSPKSPNGVNAAGQEEIDRLTEQRKLYDHMIDEHQSQYDNMAAQADALLNTPDLAAVGGAMRAGTAAYADTRVPPGGPIDPRDAPPPGKWDQKPKIVLSPTTGKPLAVKPLVPGGAPTPTITPLPVGDYHDPTTGVTVHIIRKKKPAAATK
jgi:hypothetical protein